MAVTIREMRLDDLDTVVRAAEQFGATIDRARVVHSLSLVACAGKGEPEAGDDMPGAVLCVRDGDGVALDVMFHATLADPALVGELVDKAMTKMQSAHIRACRIRIHGDLPAENDPLSTGSNWFDRFATRHHAA